MLRQPSKEGLQAALAGPLGLTHLPKIGQSKLDPLLGAQPRGNDKTIPGSWAIGLWRYL